MNAWSILLCKPRGGFQITGTHHQTSCPHRVELPEILIKHLNPFSLCLSCSHQESRLTAAATMWEELSASKGCPTPAKADCLLSPSLPPAPSLLHTWGREDDYHQPAVLQCPDGHLSPAVHCRSVIITLRLSATLPVRQSKVLILLIPGRLSGCAHIAR